MIPVLALAAHLAIGAAFLAFLIHRSGGLAAVRTKAGGWRFVLTAAAFVITAWPAAIVILARRDA